MCLLLLLLLSLLLPPAPSIGVGGVAGATSAAFASSLDFRGDAISGDLDFAFELADDSADVQHRARTSSDGLVEAEIDTLLTGEQLGDAGGVALLKVAPSTFNFGRGAGYAATTSVRAGEPLFAVSLRHVMSLESAARGRIGVLLAANPEMPPAVALALHLLEERCLGARSNFSEMIASLPLAAEALNSTLFYSREQLAMLEGSQLLRVVSARATALDHFYRALFEPLTSRVVDPPLFTPSEFTLANFRWALGVVWSHAFPLGGSEHNIVLAPVLSTIAICADSEQCAVKSRVELQLRTQQLIAYAAKSYAAGDEIELFIGDKSSTLLMANHGFARAQPSPTLDQVDIAIVLDANDALADVKAFLLRSQNMSMNDTYALRLNEPHTLSTDMATSLKIKLLSGAELSRFQDLLGPVKNPKQPYSEQRRIVGLRNEFAYTRALLLTCANLLGQYRTTLEQDELALRELSDTREASREAQILRALVLEKRILHATMELVKQQWVDLVLSDHPNLLRTGDE